MNSSRAGLARIGHALWVPTPMASDLLGRCIALLERCAPDSVVSSITAGTLHSQWLPPFPDAIHVATAVPEVAGRSMTRSRRPEIVAHRLQLDEQDVMMLAGVPVMTPARTWFDLATVLSLPDLVAAGDSVLRSGVELDELLDVVDRLRGRRGSARVRAAIPMLDARSRSRAESHLRVAIWTPDLPRFEVNEAVYRDEGGWLAEPDLSLAEARLALEYQGKDHAEVRRMRGDITRRRDMRSEGWLTLDYGPAEVFGRPWTIAPEVRAEVLDRAPHLLRPDRRPRRHIARVVA